MSWLERQSFLGANSDQRLASMTVGLVGLGGGNSHVAQQLAHAGVGHFVLVDADHISLNNLNRLIGGTWWYVLKRTAKVAIMKSMILAINPKACVEIHCKQWQLAGDALKRCEVIVGGLDNVRGKDELDAFCRRFMIPYIDQGMDVHKLCAGNGHLVAGQVVLSEHGSPCLRCMGIVTDAALAEESRKYGVAGGRPQVVWSNGVLASLAVGLIVQMVTPWSRRARPGAYLSYDGNSGLVTEAERFRRWSSSCTHYPNAAVGDVTFDIRKFMAGDMETDRRGRRWAERIMRSVRKWTSTVT